MWIVPFCVNIANYITLICTRSQFVYVNFNMCKFPVCLCELYHFNIWVPNLSVWTIIWISVTSQFVCMNYHLISVKSQFVCVNNITWICASSQFVCVNNITLICTRSHFVCVNFNMCEIPVYLCELYITLICEVPVCLCELYHFIMCKFSVWLCEPYHFNKF